MTGASVCVTAKIFVTRHFFHNHAYRKCTQRHAAPALPMQSFAASAATWYTAI